MAALGAVFCLAALAAGGRAQDAPTDSGTPDAPAPRDTFFEHSNTAKWWVSGQANFVFQAHGDFYAAYSGTNSLHDTAEHATSRVLTLFTGYEFTPNSILYLDVEEAGWGGISGALGLAGFTNLDVVRNPQLGGAPYIARLMFQQIIPFSKEKIEVPRGPLTLATQVPVRRLEIRFGKFSMADFFDNNVGGSDSHYQFLNWTAANNGAWDYAADTRGYTVGAILDYEDRNWGLRFAEALMPKVANGPNLDADVARARAENIELELRYKLLKNKDTTVRFLNYVNHGNMGTYREAIATYLADPTQPPDVIATRKQGTIKYGFGINFQQELSSDVWAFGRWGWADRQVRVVLLHRSREHASVGRLRQGNALASQPRSPGRDFPFERNRRVPSDLPGRRRAGISARRRRTELRPRDHRGSVLHRPRLAGTVFRRRLPAHQQPRL